ncbi:uncharacterized protein N7483_005310 [Penicillium malachiteum]|uniref:uncharacterized protein n=1 Tax=Penicillium malachiteum TaxID=1324776 RepID=UPI00254907D2|nr:uncharacterized protein N7483_005310 [Penicillium malachiteum]KAJ5730802.1 hypothetical protein N7483_005310 [Penicillium malachiteum]
MGSELPMSSHLEEALHFLLKNQKHENSACHSCTHQQDSEWILEADTWSQLEAVRKMLCQRPAVPQIPADTLTHIEAVIKHHNNHKLHTSANSINPSTTITRHDEASPEKSTLNLSIWKGDITTLTDITAIVNAANTQLEGCFQPEHRCIDNVIHSAAGPQLRDACHDVIVSQGYREPVGSAKITPGFNLPAPWVLHTVGPQLSPRQKPQAHHRAQLASCYRACLDAADSLPPSSNGKKIVVFCCISTGLFAFPADTAATIAVETVVSWFRDRSTSSITDVIFDTFLESDEVLYRGLLETLPGRVPSLAPEDAILVQPSPPTSVPVPAVPISSVPILKAREWLAGASHLIITAGAGLSAAAGLDYTSTTLFQSHFPAFKAKGLHRLYDVFGYNGWDNPCQKWGYYFLHLDMVRKWPVSPIYGLLHELVNEFSSASAVPSSSKYHIRTTNADGFFVKNGFPAENISTPQGQYAFLQCLRKCRADAVFASEPFLKATLPFIDPVSQSLTNEELVPMCRYCGGEVTICVRGGNYFNPAPFHAQEKVWKRFLERVHELDRGTEHSMETGSDDFNGTVILELGVGVNTPGVLRWPNEDLIESSSGVRLIRVGMDASGCVPWEMEEEGRAIGILGDIGIALKMLVSK